MPVPSIYLNTDPLHENVIKYGGAYKLDWSSIPKELKIIFTKDTHFELVPRVPGMSVSEFNELVKKIKLIRQ